MKYTDNPEKINTGRRALLRTAPAAGLAAMMAGAVPAAQAEPDILDHVCEILRIMQETAPDDANLIGFQFRVDDVGLPENVWATARLPNGNLSHLRPGQTVGWHEARVRFVGGAV